MMAVIGRPREFDREAVLRAAMLLFWEKGFLATSMTDLCAAMGIRSPSLYAAFGSKEELYREAIAHYAATVRPLVWDHLTTSAKARDGMAALLHAAAEGFPDDSVTPTGCMVTLGAIGEDYPGGLADMVRIVRREGLDLIRARLVKGVEQGELASGTDVDRLSRFYLAVFQGIVIQSRDKASADDLRGVAETAMAAWPAG